MEWLSKYLIAIFIAWLAASLIKLAIDFAKRKKLSKQPIFTTGGMPSAHTASVVALTTTIGLLDGVNSAPFAISLLFAVIVMTDALQVRRSVGELGEVLIRKLSGDQKRPHLARGHKPLEVLVGAILGLASGIATFYLL